MNRLRQGSSQEHDALAAHLLHLREVVQQRRSQDGKDLILKLIKRSFIDLQKLKIQENRAMSIAILKGFDPEINLKCFFDKFLEIFGDFCHVDLKGCF